jgi:hypothetical protein
MQQRRDDAGDLVDPRRDGGWPSFVGGAEALHLGWDGQHPHAAALRRPTSHLPPRLGRDVLTVRSWWLKSGFGLT